MKDKLTPKQKLFCEEYLVDLNATKAAERAGYHPKYKIQYVYKMMNGGRIREYITELMKLRVERTRITSDMVLQEIAAIAFSDIRDYVEQDEEGLKVKPIHTLTAEQARAIKIVTGKPGVSGSIFSLRLHDKLKALELIGRHLAMFTDRVELPQFNSFRIGYGGEVKE